MNNPFEPINARLTNLEALTLEVLQCLRSAHTSPADEVFTIEQAADFLSVTPQTVYGLVSDRKIPFSKPTGSRLYFSRLELIEWLKAHRTATVQEQAQQFDQTRPSRRKSANSKMGKAAR